MCNIHWAPQRGDGCTQGLSVLEHFGTLARVWEKLLDAVPSQHLGLSCDPSHWLWMGMLPVEDVIRDFAGKWFFADVKDCEISERMKYRQGIIGNWWWQYRVPGRGQLNWSTIIGALLESDYSVLSKAVLLNRLSYEEALTE